MRNASGKLSLCVTIALCLLLAPGCRKERYTLVFSHQKHVVENELECAACHEPTPAGAMSRPGHDNCSICHEIDEENPSEACLTCHQVKSPEAIEVKYLKPAAKQEIVFSHEEHSPYAPDCGSCHIRVTESTAAKENLLPQKQVCLKCHDDITAPLENCSVCHVETSPVNATHRDDWEIQHGMESRFGDSKCFVCHREDTCIRCHQDEEPRDHTNTWRRITHGAEAAWNRSRCMVCHQEDFCERCHSNTKPRSHRSAAWAFPPSQHCTQCHLPISQFSCSVCHKLTAHPTTNKPLARPPHPIPPGFEDCSICHIP